MSILSIITNLKHIEVSSKVKAIELKTLLYVKCHMFHFFIVCVV